MSEIINLYIKKEISLNYLYYIRQVLYLIPVLAIVLMFASTQNIKYVNQSIFLQNTGYHSISTGDDVVDMDNTFKVYKGKIAVVEDVRGAVVYKKQYNCSVFGIVDTDYNYENTYFTEKNMKGIDLATLKEDEIVISYDVAQKINVREGDVVTFVENGDKEETEYRVKGIFKTKYSYGLLGTSGTVVIKDNDNLEKMYEYDYYHFNNDDRGNISKDMEHNECNFLALPTKSVIMVNVVFPMIGILLVIVLLYREIKHLIKKISYDFAVMTVWGIEKNNINKIIYFLEGIVGIVASLGTMIVYKYLILQQLLGEYVPIRLCLTYFMVIVLIFALIIKFNTRIVAKYISQTSILKTLQKRG